MGKMKEKCDLIECSQMINHVSLLNGMHSMYDTHGCLEDYLIDLVNQNDAW